MSDQHLMFGVLIFLGVSLLFYVLFAGADFGAGILELFMRKGESEQRKLISHAMAPVWEANHIWIILAIVILFTAFPQVYSTLSIYLHLPVLAILIGIVARGCAFTFRYYDTLSSDFYRLYTRIFSVSSLWTSFFLGVLAGSIILGRIQAYPYPFMDYFTLYIAPWWNLFSFSMGIFVSTLFAFLAAIYLVGEAEDPLVQNQFRKKALVSQLLMVLSGALVFISAEWNGLPLTQEFFKNPFSIFCFALATGFWVPFWYLLTQSRSTLLVRMLGSGAVGLVLLGWYAVQYPVAVRIMPSQSTALLSDSLTFGDTVAPRATLQALLGALTVGSLLIFPTLGYLFRVFKWRTLETSKLSPKQTG